MTIYRRFHIIRSKSHVDTFRSFHVIDEQKKFFHFLYIYIYIYINVYVNMYIYIYTLGAMICYWGIFLVAQKYGIAATSQESSATLVFC